MFKLIKTFLALFFIFFSFLLVAYLSVGYWLEPVIVKALDLYSIKLVNINDIRLAKNKLTIRNLILKTNYNALESDLSLENIDFDLFNSNLVIKKIETDLNIDLEQENKEGNKFSLPTLPINSIKIEQVLLRIRQDTNKPILEIAELTFTDLLYDKNLASNFSLSIPKINYFAEFNDFNFNGRFDVKNTNEISVSIDTINVKAFDGIIKTDPFKYDTKKQSAKIKLYLKNLDLDEIFRIYPSDRIKVSGKINAIMPIDIGRKGITISKGSLESLKGGVINVVIPSTSAALAQVKDILANFVYEELKGGVNIDNLGIAKISLTIKGENPNLNKNQPAVVNLNIEENLPALIKSLSIKNKIIKK